MCDMIRLHCSSVEYEHASDPDCTSTDSDLFSFQSLASLKTMQQNHVTLLHTLEEIIDRQSAHILACEAKIIDLNATLETFYNDKYDNVSLFETLHCMSEELYRLNSCLNGVDDGIYQQKQSLDKLLDENFILRGFCQVEHKISSRKPASNTQSTTGGDSPTDKEEIKEATASTETEDPLQILADTKSENPNEDELLEQLRVLNGQVLRLQSELTERLIKVDSLERDMEELQAVNESLTEQLEQSEFKERRTHSRLMALLDESDQAKFKYERDIINCMNLVEEKQQKLSSAKTTLHQKEKEIQEIQTSLQKFGEENDSLKQKIYDLNSELYQKVNELNDFHVEADKDQERIESELAKEKSKVSQLSKDLKNRDEEIEFLEQEIMKKQEIDEKALRSEVQKLEKDRQHIIDNKHEQIRELRAKIDQLEEFNFSRRAFVDFEMEEAKLRDSNMKVGLMNDILRNYIHRQSEQADIIQKALQSSDGTKRHFLQILAQHRFGGIQTDVSAVCFLFTQHAEWRKTPRRPNSMGGTKHRQLSGLCDASCQTIQTFLDTPSEDNKLDDENSKEANGLHEDENELTRGYKKSPGVGPDTYLDGPMYWKLYEFIKKSEHFLMWILSRRDTVNQVTQELATVETKSSLSQTKQTGSRIQDEDKLAKLVLRKEMKLTDPRVLLQTASELKKFFGLAFC